MFHFPPFIQSVLGFFLLIGPLVVLHELGHYLVARWCGVKSDVFSVGFGKALCGWTDKRGTRWQIAAIPMGGYVQFAGDANATSEVDESKIAAMTPEQRTHTLAGAALWKRALIVFAGPLANILVALVIFAAFFMIYGSAVAPPVVGGFPDGNSPARTAGLQVGDRILAIDGQKVSEFGDIGDQVRLYPGKAVNLHVRRGAAEFDSRVTLMDYAAKDASGNTVHVGILGIKSGLPEYRRVGLIDAVPLAAVHCWNLVKVQAIGLRQIIFGERSIKELGGPIRTAQVSGQVLNLGWLNFVEFSAFISINLAFINLLPIPTLDGGHLAFYAAEAIRRRPVGARSQDWAFRTGLAFVLALMLFVTINDLASLLPWGR